MAIMQALRATKESVWTKRAENAPGAVWRFSGGEGSEVERLLGLAASEDPSARANAISTLTTPSEPAVKLLELLEAADDSSTPDDILQVDESILKGCALGRMSHASLGDMVMATHHSICRAAARSRSPAQAGRWIREIARELFSEQDYVQRAAVSALLTFVEKSEARTALVASHVLSAIRERCRKNGESKQPGWRETNNTAALILRALAAYNPKCEVGVTAAIAKTLPAGRGDNCLEYIIETVLCWGDRRRAFERPLCALFTHSFDPVLPTVCWLLGEIGSLEPATVRRLGSVIESPSPNLRPELVNAVLAALPRAGENARLAFPSLLWLLSLQDEGFYALSETIGSSPFAAPRARLVPGTWEFANLQLDAPIAIIDSFLSIAAKRLEAMIDALQILGESIPQAGNLRLNSRVGLVVLVELLIDVARRRVSFAVDTELIDTLEGELNLFRLGEFGASVASYVSAVTTGYQLRLA